MTLPARLWTGILTWPMATLREQRAVLLTQTGVRESRGQFSMSVIDQ
ncbi:hypothetical protein [Moorena bouillonii]|nr:hypothetical protein [Moorena bouillonii]